MMQNDAYSCSSARIIRVLSLFLIVSIQRIIKAAGLAISFPPIASSTMQTPVRKIFLYLLLLVAQGDTVSLPDRYFVHRWQLLQVYRLLLSVYSYIFIKISCFTLILLSPLFQHGIVLFRLLGKEP